MHGVKGSQTMRRRQRRRKWPLQLGLFLMYVLVQFATSTTSPKPTTTTALSNFKIEETTIFEKNGEIIKERIEVMKNTTFDEKTGKIKEEAEVTLEKTSVYNMTTTLPPKESQKENTTEKPVPTSVPGKKENQSKENETSSSKHNRSTTTSTSITTTTSPTAQMTTTNYPYPTLRPRRTNCTAPAIEQFPRPLMGPEARKHGGLIIHIVVAFYTFLGLAIVCDDYFVSSLDRICEELRLSPDVAGATFMAAGSSAPELATVIIGVFFAKDDIGVSGVIGSAVFNIMFVISICGLCTSTATKLNWWPLCRDCFFYAVSILVMLGTIFNDSISWLESLFMLVMYGVYCVALSFNAQLERWAKSYNIPFLPKDDEPAEESALVSYRSLQEDRLSYTGPNSPVNEQMKSQEGNGIQETTEQQQQQQQQPQQQQQQQQSAPKRPEYYKAKEPDPNEVSPLVMPTDGNKWTLFSWGLVYPIHYMCRATMPDCRQEKWRSWYPFTFCISMIWISFYSYIMVWMITIIGSTLGIPDTVMGLTFVAAGVSVPDALSSLAVIKEGLGDMAVSNAVGSNVFDILVCLGLPWFIQTAMIHPGSHVNVTSRGLTYSTVSLLSTVIFLVVATHLNGWKLDRQYGLILMVWYLIFIVFASLYELNIFGEMNPPVCPSQF
ncbi:probable sodium/potassium/calcium exchanger CG1090 [Pseudomyrmex gracilis]|uniref:probable sodium/potassium/calcium exchanger CG1090 n=1 Tax=Pseudomyrmex gracilis TaxID=219809 RepID=UPI000995D451|nr:probable sodium/potassium/calcium exchanger CG1090 [Pseudomyrmex gracilis]